MSPAAPAASLSPALSTVPLGSKRRQYGSLTVVVHCALQFRSESSQEKSQKSREKSASIAKRSLLRRAACCLDLSLTLWRRNKEPLYSPSLPTLQLQFPCSAGDGRWWASDGERTPLRGKRRHLERPCGQQAVGLWQPAGPCEQRLRWPSGSRAQSLGPGAGAAAPPPASSAASAVFDLTAV